MRTWFVSILLAIASLLPGCAMVPASTYSHGGPVVYTTSGHYLSGYPHQNHGGQSSPWKDVRVQTKEDEHGLVSFRVSESSLYGDQVDWVLRRVDDLKARCQNGGEMKRYEIVTLERPNPYSSSRSNRGDTSVRIEYVCRSKSVTDKSSPRFSHR